MKVRQLIKELQALPPAALEKEAVLIHTTRDGAVQCRTIEMIREGERYKRGWYHALPKDMRPDWDIAPTQHVVILDDIERI